MTAPPMERRSSTRIDKVFQVLISTESTGEQWLVARNISCTGMFVEMAAPLPLRTKVIVQFAASNLDPSAETASACGGLRAIARVQNHYYLQYSDPSGLRALSGVGLRFLRFLDEPRDPVALVH